MSRDKTKIPLQEILYLSKLRVGRARKDLQPGAVVPQVTPSQVSQSPGSQRDVAPVILMHWRNYYPSL